MHDMEPQNQTLDHPERLILEQNCTNAPENIHEHTVEAATQVHTSTFTVHCDSHSTTERLGVQWQSYI